MAAIPQRHESIGKRVFIWALIAAMGLAVAGFLIFTLLVLVLSIGLPDVRNFDKLAGTESTIIYDREGGILYTIHGEENRKYVPLSEISPLLQKATIAIEDDKFYEHSGFDIPGIGKAVIYEIFGIGTRRGGSTITQQLAKNAFLSSKREYTRKLKELILSVRLERAYDKNKILELYLNRIPYGNNAYGAEMASQMYFGKSASALTLGESSILAALPKAPTFYSPYGPHVYSTLDRELDPAEYKNKTLTIQDINENDYTIGLVGRNVVVAPGQSVYIPGRSDVILKRMEELEIISEEEKKAAVNEVQNLVFQKHREAIRAAHFVFYVRTLLETQFGKDVIAQGGLKVYTTLDPKLQQVAEDTVAEQIKTAKETYGASNGALFSINAKTGEVLAMIGSANYFDQEAHGNVNHVFAKRQPGSSFKPIVYAKAFLNRYSPATVIYDAPTNFGSNYIPQNYEGGFKGPMPIRAALGQSRNIPALKAYFLAGQEAEIVNLANQLGITSLNLQGNYGPPLAIGAGEVTLSEMVQAFSVFANNGIKRPIYTIMKVEDRSGDVMYERKAADFPDQAVLDPQVAYLINNILSDKSVYLGQRLDVPGHITAVKTGTSNKEITPVKILPSNLWTIGYTPSVVTGVWVGNSDGTEMKANADGYNVAAPVWAKFMTAALANVPQESFPVPEGIKWVNVSNASGKLPSADTPKNDIVSAPFASFAVPTETDDVFIKVKINKLDNKLPNKYTPEEYIENKLFMKHKDPISDYPRWQEGIRQWVKARVGQGVLDFPPTEETKIFNADSIKTQPSIQITSPVSFSSITSQQIPVTVEVNAPNGVARVVYYLDDKTTPSSTQRKSPYTGAIRFRKVKQGSHIITAKVYDKIGFVGEAKVEIKYEGPTD